MDPSILVAGAQLFGSAASNVANVFSSAISSKQSYKYAKRLAAQQFEYNKTMMQHRHQWEVDDLRSAGLNPILSAGGGGAAGSTGPGGSVNVPAPQFDFAGDLQSAISLADQLKNTKKQREQQDLQNAISAEKLKQEKIKTDYIKSDPTYFTPNKSWTSLIRPFLLGKSAGDIRSFSGFTTDNSGFLKKTSSGSSAIDFKKISSEFFRQMHNFSYWNRPDKQIHLFKGDDGMWFRHDMKPLTPRDRQMIRKLERR